MPIDVCAPFGKSRVRDVLGRNKVGYPAGSLARASINRLRTGKVKRINTARALEARFALT
jgi:hypothetical protein